MKEYWTALINCHISAWVGIKCYIKDILLNMWLQCFIYQITTNTIIAMYMCLQKFLEFYDKYTLKINLMEKKIWEIT